MRGSSSTTEVTSKVAASRLFHVGVIESHKVMAEMLPEFVASADIIEGDGGVGTVKIFKYTDLVPYGYLKERTDALDREKLECTQTTEGGPLGAKLESATYNFKFLPAADGGSVIKVTAEYRPKAGVEMTEEDINADREDLSRMLGIVEAYLLAHPDAYAS